LLKSSDHHSTPPPGHIPQYTHQHPRPYYRQRSSTFINVYQHQSTFINTHQRSSTTINDHQRPSTTINVHQRLSTFINTHQRSSTTINVHQRSSTIINVHQRPLTPINDHQRSSTPGQHIHDAPKYSPFCSLHALMADTFYCGGKTSRPQTIKTGGLGIPLSITKVES
jgi:hypothetical protein